jgi:hypothetical protein
VISDFLNIFSGPVTLTEPGGDGDRAVALVADKWTSLLLFLSLKQLAESRWQVSGFGEAEKNVSK